MKKPTPKTVFVTVGTTKFPQLVKTVTSEEVIQVLTSSGFQKVIMQYGQGEAPSIPENSRLEWEVFSLKDSIADDIQAASLVISHAGAGSVIESLRAGKKLIVAINEDLMDNHQEELANEMKRKQYLLACTCGTLKETLEALDNTDFIPFPDHCPEMFTTYVNRVMGVN